MDDQDANQLSDIESYLVNFNREISDELPSTSTTSAYLYATNTILSNGDDIYTELRSAVGTDKVVKSNAAQETEVVTTDDQNIVQSAELQSEQTETPFSTVTIMPAELNQDLQYMLIVSNPDEPVEKISNKAGSSKQNELSVFDFDEDANGAVDGDEKVGLAGSDELYEEEDDDEDDDDEDDDEDYIDEKNGERSGNIYKCNHCSYTSTKRFQLGRHLKSHSDDRPHKCDYCTFAFKSRVALTNHTNTHKGVRPNKCKECEACFTTTGELIRHVRYRHTYEKPHRCTVCNYASVELSKLRRHVRSHTGERPYQCPHCPYASPDTFKLKRHIRVHTGERPYKCDICDMRFTQSNSLKSHRLIHTGARPIFKCELCPSTCTRKTDLRNHVLRIHTSDKPLLCRKCGKNFPDRYTYRIHSRTHDGQKCFKCELCPYSASVQRHLEHHIMTHTGERPYKCNLCHQAFRQKTLLRKHYSSVHNANSDLALKQRAKIHICPHCRRAFANEGSMTKHVKRQHGDEEGDEEDEDEDNSDESRGESSKVTRIRKQSEVNGSGSNEHNVIEYLEMEAENDDGSEEEEDITEPSPPPKKIKSSNTSKDFDQDSSPSLTAKKRRGRPRKTPCVEKDSDDDYIPKTVASCGGRSNGQATPRRRGRPPKRRLVVMETEEDEENFDDEEHDDDDETYNANSRRLIRRKIRLMNRQKFRYPDGTLAYDGEENEEEEEEEEDDEEIAVNGRESHIL